MELKYTYIIGTHVMFYEIDMIDDLIRSIINATESIQNKENITIDMFFNMSEYFEKIDINQINQAGLQQKFDNYIDRLRAAGLSVDSKTYTDNKPLTMVDYRRDLNHYGCKNHDFIVWGESDCILPKEMFQALEQIKDYASQNDIHRFVTTFAVRKMWDPSWTVLEHNDFTNKPYYETKNPDDSINEKAYNEPHSIRYTMSVEEMNDINAKADDFDIRIIQSPQFDGSGLILSNDLIKNGVNVPHCIMGHLVDDTSMMISCAQQMGDAYVQFIVKNILKVHNRQHPKKRLYALDMDSKRNLALVNTEKKGDWFYKMKELVHFNLNNFGKSQAKFKTYEDFEKTMEKK